MRTACSRNIKVPNPVGWRPRHKLQEERFEKSVVILEAFHKEYYDMPVWDGVAHEIRMKLKALGRHLENPPVFGLAEAVKVPYRATRL